MTYMPVTRDELGRTVSLSPQRERRLLKMAGVTGFNHKSFYSQYCRLRDEGYTDWIIGMAFLKPLGEQRLAELDRLFA